MKIIEAKQPNHITKHVLNGDVENLGWISIYFGESPDYRPGDIIEFLGDYMGTSFKLRDWEGKSYYVKNSGYNDKTKSSNIYQFLLDLITT